MLSSSLVCAVAKQIIDKRDCNTKMKYDMTQTVIIDDDKWGAWEANLSLQKVRGKKTHTDLPCAAIVRVLTGAAEQGEQLRPQRYQGKRCFMATHGLL